MTVKISIVSDSGLDAALLALTKNIQKSGPAFKEIGEELLDTTKERFSDEQSPDGSRWQDNAPTTKQKKRHTKILQEMGESGGLLGSLSYKARHLGVEVGTPKKYGRIHQLGGQAGRGHSVTIPKRAYLGISDSDAQEIREIIDDHILS